MNSLHTLSQVTSADVAIGPAAHIKFQEPGVVEARGVSVEATHLQSTLASNQGLSI